MIKLLFILFPLLAFAGTYPACGTWVHLSGYGMSANVENYVYEVRVVLNCNSYETLKIFAADSSTQLTNYYVLDWEDDTLTVFIKEPSVTANTRDSVYIARVHDGSTPSIANTFIAGFDGNTDVDATVPVTNSNLLDVSRWAYDSTRYIPMLDTAGTIDGFRECSQIIKLPDGTYRWATGAYTGTYDPDSAYSLLYESTHPTAQWTLVDEIEVTGSGARLYSEDGWFVKFSNGDSLAFFFEDKARGGDSDQVSVICSGDWGDTWTGKTVCVGLTANGGNNVNDFKWPGSTGGRLSPSSPTVYNDGDSAFYAFVEVKADSYKFGGTQWQLGVGATYLYKATSLRGPYVRQINKSTNTAAGDTLVPIYPLEQVHADSVHDFGGIPHGIYYTGSQYVLAISGVDSVTGPAYPQTPLIATSSRLDSGWTKVWAISGNAGVDSIWNNALTIPDLDSVGAYMLRENSSLTSVFLARGLVYDTAGHGLTGWSWFRPPHDYLGYGITDSGIITLSGEQDHETSVGLRMSSGTTALGDSFEVIAKLRALSRSGSMFAAISIGSGNVTDREDNGTFWQTPVQESGTTLQFGATTSSLFKHDASGTKSTYQNNNIPTPASYADWTEFRLQNRVSESRHSDHTWTTHRWTMKYGDLGRFLFRKNANGTAGEWAGNQNKLLVSGGSWSTGAGKMDITQFDYVLARPYYDYELFAAPGIVNRDSFAITNSTYIYQNATSNNYGASDPVHCGWTNGGGTTRANVLWHTSIAALPDSAQILYAELFVWDTIRTSPLDSVAFLAVHRMTSDWVEGTGNGAYAAGGATWLSQGYGTGVGGTSIAQADSAWTTQGGDFDPVHGEMIKLNSTSDPPQYAGMHFDITEFARFWHANPTQNFGVMIREVRTAAPNKTINQRFQTEAYGMTTHRPSIIVYWTEPDVDLFTQESGVRLSRWSDWGKYWGNW